MLLLKVQAKWGLAVPDGVDDLTMIAAGAAGWRRSV